MQCQTDDKRQYSTRGVSWEAEVYFPQKGRKILQRNMTFLNIVHPVRSKTIVMLIVTFLQNICTYITKRCIAVTHSIALLSHGARRREENINMASSRLTYHLLRGTKDLSGFEPGTLKAECGAISRKLHVFGVNNGRMQILVEL
jgi:hypothetical protein